MRASLSALFGRRPRAQLSALLKVQARLTLREPYGVGMGLGFPVILLVLFGVISQHTAGNVAGSGLTVIDLYIPTIMVISFVAIAISLPNTLVRDREMGWLRRISTTPVHPSRLLAAQLILNLVLAAAAVRRPLDRRHCHLRCAAPCQCPVLHPFARARSRDDLLAGIGCRRLSADTDHCQCRRRRALFSLLFLSGLWVQPVQVGEPLRSIMYYSPVGAAVRAVLYSVFNTTPPVATLVVLAGYAFVFAFVAVRYFRWE